MEFAIITFMLLTSAVTGAVFYRMRGGKPSLPRPVEQTLFCIVLGFSMGMLSVPFVGQVGGFVVAVITCLTGHGLYFLDRVIKPIGPETFDFILLPFFGSDPRCDKRFSHFWDLDDAYLMDGYDAAVDAITAHVNAYGTTKLYWRCVAGMAVTGGVVSLVPGLLVMFTTPHLWAGLALALSGFVSKGLAYAVGHRFCKEGTVCGEYGTGGLQWFLAVLIVAVAVLI